MACKNEIYNGIEFEVGYAIHEGVPLPEEFDIWFTEEEFLALLGGGVVDENQLPIATTTRALRFEIHGHFVTVRREEPESWWTH